MYRIDLETLLPMLQNSSGVLETFVRSVPGFKGICRVEITLNEGKITSCAIRDSKGHVLSGESAQRWLQKKVLDWDYREQTLSAMPTSPAPRTEPIGPARSQPRLTRPLLPRPDVSLSLSGIPAAPSQPDIAYGNAGEQRNGMEQGHSTASASSGRIIPRRRVHPSPQQLQSWPRLPRAIFLLVDGVRTVEAIARLLQQDQQQVFRVIIEMAQADILSI